MYALNKIENRAKKINKNINRFVQKGTVYDQY